MSNSLRSLENIRLGTEAPSLFGTFAGLLLVAEAFCMGLLRSNPKHVMFPRAPGISGSFSC